MRAFSWYLSFIIIISMKVYFVNFPRSLKSFNSVCGIIIVVPLAFLIGKLANLARKKKCLKYVSMVYIVGFISK